MDQLYESFFTEGNSFSKAQHIPSCWDLKTDVIDAKLYLINKLMTQR
jgi:hypothetical protein